MDASSHGADSVPDNIFEEGSGYVSTRRSPFFLPRLSLLLICLFRIKKNRDQETPSQYGCRPGAANFSGRASSVPHRRSEGRTRGRAATSRLHLGPSRLAVDPQHQAPPPPASFSGSAEAEAKGSGRRSGGAFSVSSIMFHLLTRFYTLAG